MLLLSRRFTVVGLVAFLGLASTTRADVVLQWNALMRQTFAAEGSTATPPSNSRTMGMLGGAVFDAVNSITRTHSAYLGYFDPMTTGVGIDASAAAAAAAHMVMQSIYQDIYGPSNSFAANFTALYESQMNGIADGGAKTRGIEVGMAAAQAMIAARAVDGWDAVSTYEPMALGTPGRWQPGDSSGAWGAGVGSFLKPQWAEMTPFGLTSAHQFRPNGPNGFNPTNYTAWIRSPAYTADFQQVQCTWECEQREPNDRPNQHRLLLGGWTGHGVTTGTLESDRRDDLGGARPDARAKCALVWSFGVGTSGYWDRYLGGEDPL
jgi:hypothetical protein